MTEDETVGWHHRFNGHEFEQTPGHSEGQGDLACRSPWVTKSRTRLSDGTTPPILQDGWSTEYGRVMPGCLGDWVIKEHGASILGNLCFFKKIFYLSLIFISWLSQHQVIQTLKLPREEARMARN